MEKMDDNLHNDTREEKGGRGHTKAQEEEDVTRRHKRKKRITQRHKDIKTN